jgi:hypothetical protein
MSRGVVLWPDDATSSSIETLWVELEEAGIATLSTEGHGRHRPHVSLMVGEGLDPQAAQDALVRVPQHPIPLQADSVAIFPGGTIVLNVVMSRALIDEHHRVVALVGDLLAEPWSFYRPDHWTPHLTIAHNLTPTELAIALPIIEVSLPIAGVLDSGGIEDGSTGERWVRLPAG